VVKRAEVTRRPSEVLPHWDDGRVFECLRKAPEDAQVRILQTWIPEKEQLCHRLEDLILEHGKRFSLQIMLMHPGAPRPAGDDLLDARMWHRDETRDYARSQIIDTAERFLSLQDKVDRGLAQQSARLNLSVRLYRFMPFGPLYQIGDRLFVGHYHPTRSSATAPMLEIRGGSGPVWRAFQSAFTEVWEEAEEVVDAREGELVVQAPRPAGPDHHGDVVGGPLRRPSAAAQPSQP
jgi:hypothetical protein